MFAQRLQRLQQIVAAAGLDAVALLPGYNLAYLSGVHFHLSERPIVCFVPPQGDPTIVLPGLERVKLEDADPFPVQIYSYDDTSGPDGAFAAALGSLGLGGQRLGVEGLVMRVYEEQLLQRFAPGLRIEDAGDALAELRLRKDTGEVDLMRRAIRISQEALDATLAEVRPGMTERQIAGRLRMALLGGGGESLPFGPIVLTGPNSALPHGSPGDRPLAEGELLLVDWGTTIGGYASDITRTFVLGDLRDTRLQDAYAAVLAANAAGREAAGPGVPCQEVDRAARAAIEHAGFGEYFIHRLGHGLGMDVHEGPYLRAGNAMRLQAGHIVTVEPGIYLPGVGGIRIEDDVLITADGAESLTDFPRELRAIGGWTG